VSQAGYRSAIVKLHMTRNQPETIQKRRIFRELKNVALAELSSN